MVYSMRRYFMAEPITLYKLIVLYMLQKVDFPMTTTQLSDFILERGYTTFFTLQTVLSELLDSQMISVESVRNSSYYSITEAGTEALGYFRNDISSSIREEIDQYLCENKMKMRDEVSVLSDYYKNTDGDFSVHALVKEKYSNPIELTISVPDEEEAQTACSNWRDHAQGIYEFIIKELLAAPDADQDKGENQ